MKIKGLRGGILLLALLTAGTAAAEVNVNINIGVPRLVIASPPLLVVYPGTYVYVASGVDADLVFYHDHWYRFYGGGWYVSLGYNGPWRVVTAPLAVRRLPQNFRHVPPGQERVPFGQVKQNWRTWETERHWDRPEKGGGHDGREKGFLQKNRGHDGRGKHGR